MHESRFWLDRRSAAQIQSVPCFYCFRIVWLEEWLHFISSWHWRLNIWKTRRELGKVLAFFLFSFLVFPASILLSHYSLMLPHRWCFELTSNQIVFDLTSKFVYKSSWLFSLHGNWSCLHSRVNALKWMDLLDCVQSVVVNFHKGTSLEAGFEWPLDGFAFDCLSDITSMLLAEDPILGGYSAVKILLGPDTSSKVFIHKALFDVSVLLDDQSRSM